MDASQLFTIENILKVIAWMIGIGLTVFGTVLLLIIKNHLNWKSRIDNFRYEHDREYAGFQRRVLDQLEQGTKTMEGLTSALNSTNSRLELNEKRQRTLFERVRDVIKDHNHIHGEDLQIPEVPDEKL